MERMDNMVRQKIDLSQNENFRPASPKNVPNQDKSNKVYRGKPPVSRAANFPVCFAAERM